MNGDGCMSLLKSRSFWFIPGTKNKVPTIDWRCFTGRSIQNPHGGFVLFLPWLHYTCLWIGVIHLPRLFRVALHALQQSWSHHGMFVCKLSVANHNKTQRRLNLVHYCWDFLYSPLWWIDVSPEHMQLQQWILAHWPLGDVVVFTKV